MNCRSGVERDVGPLAWLDAPNQFPDYVRCPWLVCQERQDGIIQRRQPQAGFWESAVAVLRVVWDVGAQCVVPPPGRRLSQVGGSPGTARSTLRPRQARPLLLLAARRGGGGLLGVGGPPARGCHWEWADRPQGISSDGGRPGHPRHPGQPGRGGPPGAARRDASPYRTAATSAASSAVGRATKTGGFLSHGEGIFGPRRESDLPTIREQPAYD